MKPSPRAWLRTILKNVFLDEIRQFAHQGNGTPVASLCQALEDSSLRLEKCLAADTTTPSQQMIREEQLVRLRPLWPHYPGSTDRG